MLRLVYIRPTYVFWCNLDLLICNMDWSNSTANLMGLCHERQKQVLQKKGWFQAVVPFWTRFLIYRDKIVRWDADHALWLIRLALFTVKQWCLLKLRFKFDGASSCAGKIPSLMSEQLGCRDWRRCQLLGRCPCCIQGSMLWAICFGK